jgi:hypothetical protein
MASSRSIFGRHLPTMILQQHGNLNHPFSPRLTVVCGANLSFRNQSTLHPLGPSEKSSLPAASILSGPHVMFASFGVSLAFTVLATICGCGRNAVTAPRKPLQHYQHLWPPKNKRTIRYAAIIRLLGLPHHGLPVLDISPQCLPREHPTYPITCHHYASHTHYNAEVQISPLCICWPMLEL